VHAFPVAVQVLRAGDWTEQLMSGLTKLGCCLLDTHIISFPCKALAAFVQEPTAAGLLDALAAAQAVSAAGQAQLLASQHGRVGAGSGVVSVHAQWQQQLQQLSGAERHHLRTYLLQGKWFSAVSAVSTASGSSTDGSATGFTQQQVQVLRSLPIFEVHPPLPYEDSGSGSSQELQQRQQQQDVGLLGLLQAPGPASSDSAPVAGAGAGPYPQGQYRSLSPTGSQQQQQQQQQQVLLPPQGLTNGQVLGSQFLKCESESEEAVLVKHLGVPRLSMQEFLMLHLAKAPQQLDPRALVSTMTYILCRLKQLSVAEPDLPLALKVLPVIPTRAGVVQQAAAAAPGVSQGSGQGSSQVLGGPGRGSSQVLGGPGMQQAQQLRQQLVLAPPCDLFDPRNGVLVQLLEPRHFPAAPFDGSVDSRAGAGGVAAAVEAKALLEGLTLCGLRTKLDLEVRLLCWVAWGVPLLVSMVCIHRLLFGGTCSGHKPRPPHAVEKVPQSQLCVCSIGIHCI
jgi:hypothetical protein